MEKERNVSQEKQPGRTIVLFDVDNTLVQGFSIFYFADFLLSRNLFHSDARQVMETDYTNYRNKKIDYRDFAVTVVDHYSLGLKGFSQQEVTNASRDFLPAYIQKLFLYSKELVDLMNQVGETIVVSGAPKEAFLQLGKYLGIKRAYLLEARVKDGYYTGQTKVNMALNQEKEKVIRRLSRRRLDTFSSFAFGDSIHDLPILTAVSNPFVVGSHDSKLTEIAQKSNWPLANPHNIIELVRQRIAQLQK